MPVADGVNVTTSPLRLTVPELGVPRDVSTHPPHRSLASGSTWTAVPDTVVAVSFAPCGRTVTTTDAGVVPPARTSW